MPHVFMAQLQMQVITIKNFPIACAVSLVKELLRIWLVKSLPDGLEKQRFFFFAETLELRVEKNYTAFCGMTTDTNFGECVKHANSVYKN